MAIYQISQIQQRAGLQIDLPQLAGAQLGWSYDTRQLWIGNGALLDGAPVVGNTEILTEFSDILALPTAYTFQGASAGYIAQTGPSPGDPTKLSMQQWMDQFVTIKDFGAKGDGVTDDTAAINNALYQIYCVQDNPQVRRAIYFPAGVYLVSDSIKIPPYARLYGDGIKSSIIRMVATPVNGTVTVAQTADSKQQTGLNIGNGGAITPRGISISNMGFESLSTDVDLFRLDSTIGASFDQVSFIGPLEQAQLTNKYYRTAALRISSNATTGGIITADVIVAGCQTSGTLYAVSTMDIAETVEFPVVGCVLDSIEFGVHYQGVVIGEGTSLLSNPPTGVKITNSLFSSIFAEGIVFGVNCVLNASAYNVFYDVGNGFGGSTSPQTYNILIQSNNNVSIGDLFQRTDAYAQYELAGTSWPRVGLSTNNLSIAFDGTSQVLLGNYTRGSGYQATLLDNTTVPGIVTNSEGVPLNVYTANTFTFKIDYSIIRGTFYRTGSILVAADSGTTTGTLNDDLSFDDTFIENKDTGITLIVVQPTTEYIQLQYVSTTIDQNATFTYSITKLA